MSLRDKLNDHDDLKRCWNSIYSSKQKSKRAGSKGPDDISIEEFRSKESYYFPILEKKLVENSYKMGKLAWFAEKKPEKNKYRLITVATVQDRIVQKRILDLIHPSLFPYINTGVSYCGVKKDIWKKDTDALNTRKAFVKIIEHVKDKKYWVFKSDIKGFYDNVPKRKFYNLFVKLSNELLKDTSLNSLIKEMIYFKLEKLSDLQSKHPECVPPKYKGICQGSALSQFFANMYLTDFDITMKKKYGDRYIRYIDDFIVFCDTKEEANKVKEKAIKLLKKKGLELSPHESKTKITTIKGNYINFLGLRIDKNKITSKKNTTEIQKWIKDILNENNREYRKCIDLPEKIKYMNYKISGYGEYLKHYHSEDIYKEINKWIKEKRKKDKFKKIDFLNKLDIKPVISEKDWQAFFV